MAGLGCMNGFVVALCVLTLLFGAVTLFAGVAFRLEKIMGSESMSLLNNIKRTGIPLGKLLLTHAISMMVMGGTIMIKSVTGIRGAVKTGKCVLRLLIGMEILVILVQVVLAGMWITTRILTDGWLHDEMLNLLKEYRGPQYTDDISKGWNNLFMQGSMTKLKEVINRYSLIYFCTAGGHFILQILTILGSYKLLKTDTARYFRGGKRKRRQRKKNRSACLRLVGTQP